MAIVNLVAILIHDVAVFPLVVLIVLVFMDRVAIGARVCRLERWCVLILTELNSL